MKDDLISRQAAIDALRDYLVGKRCPDDGTLICRLIENEVINKLPTIHSKLSTNLAEVGMDCISRAAAIDALRTCYDTETITMDNGDEYINYGDAVGEIEQLPTAKPDIIYCKDCKHFIREDIEEYTPYGFYNTYFHAFCDKHWDGEQGEYIDVKLDDFCSFAERRGEQDGCTKQTASDRCDRQAF